MKNLKEMKKLKLGFLILILLFLNSCSLNTNFETKNKITKKGKFSFLVEEKVYTGLLKIEKLENKFFLQMISLNSNEELKIEFSDKKTFLEKKELKLFEATRSLALKKFNFFKYLNWIFEPCNEKKCLKLTEDNYSFDKIIKGTSMLVETSNDQQSFSLKLFLE